jgi:hypothetical protein
MYTLTLTHEERKAFDWVGHRYAAGIVGDLLTANCMSEHDYWDINGDITFEIPENVAWEIQDEFRTDDAMFPCFSPELSAKLQEFLDKIV